MFVGNNRYRIEGLRMGSRDRLDCGEICVCSARPMSRTGLVRMMLLGLTGGLRSSGDLDVRCTRELWVDTRPRGVDVTSYHIRSGASVNRPTVFGRA